MIFNTHQLTGFLQKYIESIFHIKDFIPKHSIERVVPTGHVFIIFELDGITRQTFDNDSLKPNNNYCKVWLSGIHKNYLSISAHEKSEMLVIQFKPYGAYPFFNKPIIKFSDKVIAADKIFGQEILDLREELIENHTHQKKFNAIEKWLKSLYNKGRAPPNELLNIINELHSNTVTNYKQIIQSYSKTHKHLIDQFKKYIGVTPKYYQRIIRFNEVLHQLHQSKQIDWAQFAFDFEYSDQSHFIKEFKFFSGFNPVEFINKNYHKEELNFFPIDEK